ncbi:MAG: zf-HC2 domain-containing protein [Thermodesulfobacteriota bacterium]|nr:zf-HC2 domain-containing protein [Thermodesulfobacteriota bacterium]
MNCKKIIALLYDYMDEDLPPDLMEEVSSHLDKCKMCKTLFHTYSLTIRLTNKVETHHNVPPEMLSRLKALLHTKLRPDE